MNHGHIFEELIYNSFAEKGIHIARIKTRITQYKGDNEVADFYTYHKGVLLYIEAKSTKESRFSFSMLKPNQAVGLNNMNKYDGVYGGVLVEMRKYNRVFYVPITTIDDYLKQRRMSMNIKDLEENALEVETGKQLKIEKLHEEVSYEY